MSDVIHLKGQGGATFEYAPPLHREIQRQLDAGDLVQVNADGSPYTDAPAPRRSRSKAAADSA